MGNISIQQPDRFGQSLGEASQREGYGRSQAPLEQLGALPGMSGHPGSLLSMGAVREQQSTGETLLQRNDSLLHWDTQAFRKMGYLTIRGCCWCAF